jgi:hypothetical protein
VGRSDPASVRRGRGPVFLQAVGRPHAQGQRALAPRSHRDEMPGTVQVAIRDR